MVRMLGMMRMVALRMVVVIMMMGREVGGE